MGKRSDTDLDLQKNGGSKRFFPEYRGGLECGHLPASDWLFLFIDK